jgi:hypothetical protein
MKPNGPHNLYRLFGGQFGNLNITSGDKSEKDKLETQREKERPSDALHPGVIQRGD